MNDLSMARLEPQSAYSWELSYRHGTEPTPDLFREEDPARPGVADLIQPGQLLKTNDGSGPYRVESVTPQTYFGRTAWALVLCQVVDGVVKPGHFWINEVVAQWEGDAVRFLKLFRASDDEVLLMEGAAFQMSRSGQLSLF